MEMNIFTVKHPLCVSAGKQTVTGNLLSDFSNMCVYRHRCPFVSLLLSINMEVSAEDCGSFSLWFVCVPAALVSGGREHSS